MDMISRDRVSYWNIDKLYFWLVQSTTIISQPLQDSILYSEVEDALGRYFRVLDADMQRHGHIP